MARHNALVKEGEQVACEFLISKGMEVRDRNWRLNNLEIDIVAYEGSKNLLHIVEVKTRSSVQHFDPLKAVNRAKQRFLINAANGYIRFFQMRSGIQFDIIIIVGTPGNFTVQYIPNAFAPRLKTYR